MATSIHIQIQERAKRLLKPDESEYLALSVADAQELAKTTGMSVRDIHRQAMEQGIIPERYSRNGSTLSLKDQLAMLLTHVAIIGQGGLGGTVTETLARMGVGELTLIDGDVFEESNLNRQLLSSHDNLGTHKATAGKERVQRINSGIKVKAIIDFIDGTNSKEYLQDVDICVDCLDTITARLDLQKSCQKLNIPLVSAAIGGTAGQATVIFPGDEGLQQIYGSTSQLQQKGVEVHLGTLAYGAGFMAAVECAEVIRLICTQTSTLRNSLLITDIATHSMDTVVLSSTEKDEK